MWTKDKDGWVGQFETLVLRVKPKGDGRWTWEAAKDATSSSMASGVAASANQAKRNAENFARRGP